jgi:hypothetical protein
VPNSLPADEAECIDGDVATEGDSADVESAEAAPADADGNKNQRRRPPPPRCVMASAVANRYRRLDAAASAALGAHDDMEQEELVTPSSPAPVSVVDPSWRGAEYDAAFAQTCHRRIRRL